MKLKIDTWEARRKVGFSTTVETTVDQVSSWEKPGLQAHSDRDRFLMGTPRMWGVPAKTHHEQR